MTSLKLACRLAFSSDVRQRWRQFGILVSSAIAALVLLGGIALVHVARVSDQRVVARSPVEATSSDRAVLESSTRALVISGRDDLGQFPVIWLEPRPGHEHDRHAIPPGLSAMPGPGEGVLSPGLVARGFTAEDFGLHSSSVGRGPRGSIGADGLTTGSEGWIYARPAVGRTLGLGGSLTLLEGYETSGVRSANRVNQETVLEVPSAAAASVGLLWLVIAPALYLALGAARSLSALRLERSGTLVRLGIASWRIRGLLALETVALGGPGLVVGATLWFAIGERITTMPLTGVTLLPDALATPWLLNAGALMALAAMIGISGMIGSLDDGARRRGRRRPHPLHVLPLLSAVGMMAASRVATPMSPQSAGLLFGGVILCVASLPLALPWLALAAGAGLARRSRPGPWLAGRRLTFDAITLARPAATVAALVLIAGAAFAIYGRITGGADDPREGRSLQGRVAQLDWRDERPDDMVWARLQLAGLVTARTGQGASGEPVAIVDHCGDAARALGARGDSWCRSGATFSDRGREEFRTATHYEPVTTDHAARVSDYSLLLLSDRSIDQREVMKALAPRLPAVNVSGNGASAPYLPVGWLIAGWVLASLVLSAAVIREIGDRALAALNQDTVIRALGLSAREVGSVHRWSILIPVLVALPVGYLAAVVFALYGNYLGFTLYYLGRVTIVSAAVALTVLITLHLVFAIHRRTVPSEARPPG